MKIAIDISPLESGHKVRGTGFYLQNLKTSLLNRYPDNTYVFFGKKIELPKDIDLIHFPYFDPFFRTLPFIKKYKTVVTVHDLIPLVFPKEFPAGIKGSVKWNIQKNLLQKVDAIVTDSDCSQKDIIRLIGIKKEKVHVIYLAAGDTFTKLELSKSRIKEFREKYKLPERFLLYVGDVTWNKNLPRLIDAVKQTFVPLVLIGKALGEKNYDIRNPWNKDLVKVQEMIKNDSRFITVGFISSKDLVIFYNIATALIMPSLYEGFGLPVLEAMKCGCPVITTNESSLPEIAGNAAFYIDPYDVTSITKGIEKVYSDENLRNELKKKGEIQVKKFDWRKTADKTMAVYKKVYETKNS